MHDAGRSVRLADKFLRKVSHGDFSVNRAVKCKRKSKQCFICDGFRSATTTYPLVTKTTDNTTDTVHNEQSKV